MRILVHALLVLAVSYLGACSPERPKGPSATAEAFYAAYFTLPPGRGTPDEAGRAKLAPYFTPALNQLLADAAAAEERHGLTTNNQEPPLVEGDPFTSMFEGATELIGRPACTGGPEVTEPLSDELGGVRAVVSSVLTASCDVNLAYKDSSGTSQWKDQLLLRKTSAWFIEDIVLGGAGPFNRKGHLTDLLKAVIAEAPK